MWEITWPWIDRENVKCATLKEAREIVTGSLNQDVIEHQHGHEVIFEYYLTTLAIAKDLGSAPCHHSFHSAAPETCPNCGKERH